jgi:hypothetical protein
MLNVPKLFNLSIIIFQGNPPSALMNLTSLGKDIKIPPKQKSGSLLQ